MDQKLPSSNQKIAIKYHRSDRISERRKALFPSIDNSSNDLGLILPIDVFDHAQDCFYSCVDNYKLNDNMNDSTMLYTSQTVDSNDGNIRPSHSSPLQAVIISPILCSPESHSAINDISFKDTPTKTLKTPHDTSNPNLSLPRLVRKTNLDSSFESDTSIRNTSPLSPNKQKLDTSFTKNSKVRTALFPDDDLSLSTQSFYPKMKNTRVGHSKLCTLESKKEKCNVPKMYICNRRLNTKKRFGQINAGVRHRIKKPKKKKIIKSTVLKAALNIIEKSSLNEYLEQLHQENGINKESVGESIIVSEQILNNKNFVAKERSPSPDPNKKFFKSSKMKGICTVNKHIKLEVGKGKVTLLEAKKPKYRTSKMNLDTFDLSFYEEDEVLSNETITNIIKTLEHDKENISHVTAPTSLGNIQTTDKPKNVINERKRKIPDEDQLENPGLLLSPTSQMCDMASGLAINSPKRAKLDINKLLNDMPESANFNVFNKVSCPLDEKKKALFPIFYPSNSLQEKKVVPFNKEPATKKWKSLPPDQMLLDAGQKKFGAAQCPECQIIYHMGDPNDELMHLNYHNAGSVLRFNGWKSENIIANFLDARIIKVSPGDPKVWWKKIKDLLEVVNRDLGYYEMEVNTDNITVFLYIKNKSIVGCVVTEPKLTAFKMLSSFDGIDMCTEESFPVKCGISRIWVSQGHRKKGIGTALMNSLRGNFMVGCILQNEDIALSSPTILGKMFATNYFKTPNFLIYTS